MSETARTPKRMRVHHFAEMKSRGERITMLTAYDYPTARLFDNAGVEMLLVGDSYGNAVLGLDTTIPVTLDQMVTVTGAVSRGARRAFVVADLPFGTYEASPAQCHASAVRLLKEGGASAVKFEGGAHLAEHVALLSRSGIPVVGHLGFTPQSENMLGGKRVQGRGDGAAERLIADATALQEAGAIAVVLEMVPSPVADRVTSELRIPTIGIGAGVGCEGQVLVWTDIAGLGDWSPSFAKRYADIGAELARAAAEYVAEVKAGTFPDEGHSFAT